jgi:uncharacterized protein
VLTLIYFRTPITWAAKKGYQEIVRLLVKAGANTNTLDQDDKTALHCATFMGYIEISSMLIEAGCELDL